MRIFQNFREAHGEISRDLKEMGIHVANEMMQDKVGSFPTLELLNYGFTVTSPNLDDLDITRGWCMTEWEDRRDAIMGRVSPLGNSWALRADKHMNWSDYIEYDGHPIPAGMSLEDMWATNPQAKNDPMRMSYSYGERFALNDQVMRVVRELRRNPQSRQLFVGMWDPDVDSERLGVRRVPCSLGWHFILREEKLHITYTMRSCDFVTHWQNDVWLAMQLLLFVCAMTNNQPGRFSQFVNSLHVYEKDVADVF